MATSARCSKIEISIPKYRDDPGITFRVQKLIYDPNGFLIQTVPRAKVLHRFASGIATEQVTFVSPITQQEMTLFAADVAKAIEAIAAKIVAQEYGVTPDENHRVWIE